jgi:hypothetical protein
MVKILFSWLEMIMDNIRQQTLEQVQLYSDTSKPDVGYGTKYM